MQSILILAFSPIARDPRVMRQVELLRPRYRVTVAGYGPDPTAQVEFVGLHTRAAGAVMKVWRGLVLLLGWSESYWRSRPEVRSARARLKGRRFDLIIANDIAALPLALALAGDRPVLIDAHEFSPLEFEDRRGWRLLFGRHYERLCRRYLPRAAGMTTVCQGIADEYRRRYGVAPIVIENAPPAQPLAPVAPEHGRIRMVHHGAAIRSRRLEAMIDVMDALDERFTLDFMLVPNEPQYLSDLQSRAAGNPRIRFLAPVPMPDICRALNRYDVGLFLLPPANFNYRHALPNKFFEFVQARLAVAIGPSPEMARLVREHSLGVVAQTFEPRDLARALARVSAADLAACKAAADRAAATLNFDRAGARLLELVDRLAGGEAGAPEANERCAA
jgi:hypothetical protein